MEAVCLAENTVLALKDIRSNTDEEFKQIFVKAVVMSVQIYLFSSYTKCFLLVMLMNWLQLSI